jgi:FAD:protein FMN transferase
MRSIKFLFICLFSATLSTQLMAGNSSTSPSPKGDWFSYQQPIMGTRTVVELFSDNQQQADSCSQRVFSEMNRIDQLMSPYIESSELYKINQQAAFEAITISPELFKLIQRSIEFSELTSGAFDITFASVGYLYNYREKKMPSDKQINARLDAINYRNIQLNPDDYSIRFNNKNTRIDLGGIAKGHAVDNAIKLLQECDVENALVSAGGDSRILGDKNGRPWMVGVQHPRDKTKMVVSMPLKNEAISTSGDYERFFIEEGVRHHHIMLPSTGKSANQSWSVSVLGKESLTTDALSTAMFVMGTKKGMDLINSLENTEAIIINDQGKMFYSHGLISPNLH